MLRALILAHHDQDGLIDPHVIQALQIYRRLVDRLVVVSTAASSLPAAAVEIVDDFLTRPNEGYDFYSWKLGLERLVPHHEFDEIVFCNDSVYLSVEKALRGLFPRTARRLERRVSQASPAVGHDPSHRGGRRWKTSVAAAGGF